MPTRVTFEGIAAGLSVPQRVLLFCLALDTDWQWAASRTQRRADNGALAD
jgi:hypothetical protein